MKNSILLAFTLLFLIVNTGYAQLVTTDETFGQNGISLMPANGTNNLCHLTYDNSGNIYALGSVNGSYNQFYLAVIKTDADGQPVQSFGTNGISMPLPLDFEISSDPGANLSKFSINITGENKILIFGCFSYFGYFNDQYLLLRLNEDGTQDMSFGLEGIVPIGPEGANIGAANIESDEYIVVVGGLSVSKYDYDGELVESFGDGGTKHLYNPITGTLDMLRIKVLADQSIVLAGYAQVAPTKLVCIKLDASGNFIGDFADNGIWHINTSDYSYLIDVVEDNSGNLMLLARNYSPNVGFGMIKLLPNGVMDDSFGTDGIFHDSDVPAYKIWLYGDKYLTGYQNKLMSINSNGTLDTDFNNCGVYTCENFYFRDILLQDNDKVILGGNIDDVFAMTKLILGTNSIINIERDRTIIYPNPVSDVLNLSSERMFEIIDISGKILFKSEKAEKSVNVNWLKSGIYMLRFEDGKFEKFVKE